MLRDQPFSVTVRIPACAVFIPHVVYFMSEFFQSLFGERNGRVHVCLGSWEISVCVSDVRRIRAYIYKVIGERYMYRDLIRVL